MAHIQCKHCPNSTQSSPDVARVSGWRMWSGVTEGGKQTDDVICPTCAGTAPEPEPAGPSYGVGCRTCDWEWEDEYGEGPLTAAQAKNLADDHECEPSIYITAPDGAEYDPIDLNRDGSLREHVLRRRAKTLVPVGGVL